MKWHGERVHFPLVAVVGLPRHRFDPGIHDDHARDRPDRRPVVDRPGHRSATSSTAATSGCPILRAQPKDWRGEQERILRDAGELELMDEYIDNVRKSDARRRPQNRETDLDEPGVRALPARFGSAVRGPRLHDSVPDDRGRRAAVRKTFRRSSSARALIVLGCIRIRPVA